MGKIFDSVESQIDVALKLPHVTGEKLIKTDVKSSEQIVCDGVEEIVLPNSAIASNVGGKVMIGLDKNYTYAKLLLTSAAEIDVNLTNITDQCTSTLSLSTGGNSVTFSENLVNAGTETIDNTKTNVLLFGAISGVAMYKILAKYPLVIPTIPDNVVMTFAPIESTTLRATFLNKQLDDSTEVEVSSDGVIWGAVVTVSSSYSYYDITGLIVGDLRYIRAKYINPSGVLSNDYASANATATATTVYQSATFNNVVGNYITSTGDMSSIYFGDGVSTDGPQSYAFNAKFNTLKIINPLISRGGSTPALCIFGGSSAIRANIYSGTGANIFRRSKAVLTTNTWYKVVATYDGSKSTNGLHVYINGVLSDGDADITGTYVVQPHTGVLDVGTWLDVKTRTAGDVIVSDVMVINKQLNATEVSELNSLGYDDSTSLSFSNNIVLYNRCPVARTNEVGEISFSQVGTVTYNETGAY